jgi:hypothetical protein
MSGVKREYRWMQPGRQATLNKKAHGMPAGTPVTIGNAPVDDGSGKDRDMKVFFGNRGLMVQPSWLDKPTS